MRKKVLTIYAKEHNIKIVVRKCVIERRKNAIFKFKS